MEDILDEAYAIAQCKECPWYKSCVMPLRFTADDIRRQMEAAAPGSMAQSVDLNMQNLMASMASSAQNSILEGCPVFIERLRANPKLVQRLKEIMQQWGSEPGTG